jgi:hypothetical protein
MSPECGSHYNNGDYHNNIQKKSVHFALVITHFPLSVVSWYYCAPYIKFPNSVGVRLHVMIPYRNYVVISL